MGVPGGVWAGGGEGGRVEGVHGQRTSWMRKKQAAQMCLPTLTVQVPGVL